MLLFILRVNKRSCWLINKTDNRAHATAHFITMDCLRVSRPQEPNTQVAPQRSGICPRGFEDFVTSSPLCFKIFPAKAKTRDSADQYCQRINPAANLAAFNTNELNKVVASKLQMVTKCRGKCQMWMNWNYGRIIK